jgi:hypothetical protein
MRKKKDIMNSSEDIYEEVHKQVQKPVTKNKLSKYKIIIVIIAVLALLAGGFFYYKYTKTEKYLQKKADRETMALVKKVGELMILPEGVPAVFSVEDPDVLVRQQAFFKGAEKGDSLLVYPEAGKAILYSAKRNIIVNVGPVTFDEKTK